MQKQRLPERVQRCFKRKIGKEKLIAGRKAFLCPKARNEEQKGKIRFATDCEKKSIKYAEPQTKGLRKTMHKHKFISILSVMLLLLTANVYGVNAQAKRGVTADDVVNRVTVMSDAPNNLDAVFTSDAQTAYFTAASKAGRGVFRVAASGGTDSAVHLGTPFVAPRGLAIASDDQTLYVADPQAKGQGAIFALQTNGGAPQILKGTQGYQPRGLEVANQNGADKIYFTGKDPKDGQAGVFQISASGDAAPTLIAKGKPFISPDSITIARTGEVFVTDNGTNGKGNVWKISGNQVTPLVKNAPLGNPAGVALTMDETTLLVSALQPQNLHAQVLVVNLKTGDTSTVTKVIGKNPAAGGLHRARNSNSFAWSGIIRTIYGVFLQLTGG
jgi:sugar lactone lactonase YvrE